jgi:hypothetical protein
VQDKQYIVGDKISLRIYVRHRANLARVTAVFVRQRDENTTIFLEGSPDADYIQYGDGKRSTASLTAKVTADHKVGTYRLDRIITESAGGRVDQMMDNELGDLETTRIEIVEEPGGKPTVSGRRR